MSSPGIVIIGAGHAAVRAALAARDAGYTGTVTMVAEEGTDAPYERPPLSKWSPESGVALRPIVPSAQLDGADITRIADRVHAVNPDQHQLTLADGKTLEYARLLIATGARARQMPAEMSWGATIHTLRTASDAETLLAAAATASSAAIIGGGFIGLELAASLRAKGVDCHVIEAADRLLARGVTPPVAQIVQTLHTDNGVKFTFGQQVSRVTQNAVVLGDETEIKADLIVAGIGSLANTNLAEDAGITVANGITVDAEMRTNVADIYAAGDCCSFPLYGDAGQMTRLESWQAAGDQGVLAGRNMAGASDTYTQVPWFWSNQYDHVLQVSGLIDPDMAFSERSYGADHHVSFATDEGGKLRAACGIAAGTKVAKDIRFAAKMIEAATQVAPSDLANSTLSLKSLMRG